MHTSSNLCSEVFFALCKDADTPVSLGAWLRFKYSHREFTEATMPIRDYTEYDSDRFAKDYAVLNSLRKWKGLETGVDLEAVAIQKFIASEEKCRKTNKRIRLMRKAAICPTLSSLLFRAKVKIAHLIGPYKPSNIYPYFGWGPGATSSIPRRRAMVDTKMVTMPMTVSAGAVCMMHTVLREDLHWSFALLKCRPEGDWSFGPGLFEIDNCCRVKTVPKDSRTDRVIAIEPTGNLFLQKGVGGYFRRCLRRVGIDLDDQGGNQSLARIAQEFGLATLDLSAASDTVSKELVYELLPYDWASAMDAIRSKYALLPNGEKVVLEKWSSMGNGYTFELESLIFWALGTSAAEINYPWGVLSVYGDDIICDQKCAPDLIRLLRFCGFDLNAAKSYTEGLFFESCGEHYFNGKLVTPFYQKERLDNDGEIVRFHNRIVRWKHRIGSGEIQIQMPVYRWASKELKRCLLPLGADGDDGFLAPVEDILTTSPAHDANRGIRCRIVRSVTRRLPGDESALLALEFRKRKQVECSYTLGHLHDGPAMATYGDLVLSADKTAANSRTRYGYRWVYPPGYSPLPRR